MEYKNMTEETINLLNQAKAKGINTYALLAIYRKRSKLKSEIPDWVLQEVCKIYLQPNAKIDHTFPYFLRVLKNKTEEYFSRQNEEEGKKHNKREGFSPSIASILTSIK